MNKFECPICKQTFSTSRTLKSHLVIKKTKCYSVDQSDYVEHFIANKGWKSLFREKPKLTATPQKKQKKLINLDDQKFEFHKPIDNDVYPTYKFQTFLALTLIYTFRNPLKKKNIIVDSFKCNFWNNNKKNTLNWEHFIRLLIKKILTDENCLGKSHWKRYFNKQRICVILNPNGKREKTKSSIQEFLNGDYTTTLHQRFYIDCQQTIKNSLNQKQWLPKSKIEIDEDSISEMAELETWAKECKIQKKKNKIAVLNFRRQNFSKETYTNKKEDDQDSQEVESIDSDSD